MPLVALSVSVVCVLMTAFWISLHRQAREAGRYAPMMQEWIDELAGERYSPLLCLLADHQPRTRSYRTFDACLRNLLDDFRHGNRILWFVVMRGSARPPGLAGRLIRLRLQLAATLLVLRCRLWLQRLGVGRVDPRPLLALFACMRLELHSLGPVRQILTAPQSEPLLSA